jgi:hypothetical protein
MKSARIGVFANCFFWPDLIPRLENPIWLLDGNYVYKQSPLVNPRASLASVRHYPSTRTQRLSATLFLGDPDVAAGDVPPIYYQRGIFVAQG